jgi:fatty acid desaturase (delta-4 desaturase)
MSPPVATKALDPHTIQVDGNVYSAETLANEHPGGDLFIKAFAGRDASEAFVSYHRRKFPHSKWSHAAVGKAVPLKEETADKDFLELCELVEKVVPTYKSFAPPSYYLKVFVILASAIGLEVRNSLM